MFKNSLHPILSNKDFLFDCYITQKLSSAQIGRNTGTDGALVRFYLRKFKIPLRSPRESRELNQKIQKGDIYGQFRVVSRNYEHQDKLGVPYSYFDCECIDCGSIYTKMGTSLEKYNKICPNCHRSKSYGEITGNWWNKLKLGAIERNFDFSILIEDGWNLFLQQNRRCALSGVELIFHFKSTIQTASLDRIDSTKGYIKGNIQWVHKELNMMKNKMDQDKFLYWINLINNFQKNS